MHRVLFLLLTFTLIILQGCTDRGDSYINQEFIQSYGDAELYTEIHGSKSDTLIIVHGGPGAGIQSVIPFMKPLTRNFTLIFYDQRGGGRSTLPADTSLLKPIHFTEDLEAVRKHFSIDKMNLITHSFGSILVSNYLQNYPGHVERLVLHGPTGPVRLEMGEYYQAKAANAPPPPDSSLAAEANRLLESLLSGSSDSPKSDCRRYEEINLRLAKMRGKHVGITGTSCDAPADAVAYYYEHTAQKAPANYGIWNYIGKLDHIKIPVLIIHGIDDSLAAAIQKRWTEVYPNSHFEGIPKADKGALSQRPDTTLRLITDFFMIGR